MTGHATDSREGVEILARELEGVMEYAGHLENDQCDWKNCKQTDVYRLASSEEPGTWFCLKHHHQYSHPEMYQTGES